MAAREFRWIGMSFCPEPGKEPAGKLAAGRLSREETPFGKTQEFPMACQRREPPPKATSSRIGQAGTKSRPQSKGRGNIGRDHLDDLLG